MRYAPISLINNHMSSPLVLLKITGKRWQTKVNFNATSEFVNISSADDLLKAFGADSELLAREPVCIFVNWIG